MSSPSGGAAALPEECRCPARMANVGIASFLFPLLVIVSLAFSKPLTFSLAPVFAGALVLTAIAMWQITDDGEGRTYEGWALIATYAILATITLYE